MSESGARAEIGRIEIAPGTYFAIEVVTGADVDGDACSWVEIVSHLSGHERAHVGLVLEPSQMGELEQIVSRARAELLRRALHR